jgi:hypothetical protein
MIDRDRIKQGVLKLVNARVRNQWLCVDALELAVVDHVIDEIERVDHVIDEIEGKASRLVPIDREKIKRWVILYHPTLEWSSLSDSTLSSVIDFAIDKIEEGPVEVAEVSKRKGEASELVPIDREKIKRWVILYHPTLEWSSLSDSTLSSVIDFAIDKIEEGPVEVAEVSKRNGHELWVIPTGKVGSHSGRRLHRVECVTCKAIVHEATSGPSQMIEAHLREARTGMQSPLVGILTSSPALAEPLQVGYLASVGDRVVLARIHDNAPQNHVGDLTKRLVRRILFASCTVSSGECAIRQECINKCGTFDANPEGTSR